MSGELHADEIGPVDVAVIAFGGGDVDPGVAPALADLQASGTVKVIDVAFVRKDAEGATSIVELSDRAIAGEFGNVTDSQFDLLSQTDLNDIAKALDPSTAAMVVVWENSWAARFATAVRQAHGRVAMLERIPRENVERAIAALTG